MLGVNLSVILSYLHKFSEQMIPLIKINYLFLLFTFFLPFTSHWEEGKKDNTMTPNFFQQFWEWLKKRRKLLTNSWSGGYKLLPNNCVQRGNRNMTPHPHALIILSIYLLGLIFDLIYLKSLNGKNDLSKI